MEQNNKGLSAAKEQWEQKIKEKVLPKLPERKEEFLTHSEIPVERVYTPLDTADMDYLDELGFPGEYPYTRGVQPTMYRGRLWTMRQYAGFGTAEETNKRFKYLLERGQTGLSVAFDLPTQIGYDSNHSLSYGEVGKVGVAIDSLRDVETLFEGIPLDKVSTSMTINSPAAVLLAMYIAVGEKQGVTPEKLSGTIQNDILKEYIARGTYIYPPEPSMRIITDIFRYCSENLPNWNSISISGYHIREAGSTAAQEMAFTISNGIAYVEAAIKAGLNVDEFAPRLSFFFNAHLNFFEEIAKFRAARRIWAKIMKERFGARDPRSLMLRFHTQTAGCTLTAQQADTNIMRVAYQALSAVLGGTQSLHTNSRDEALALPSEDSVLIALRTQQVIAYETGVMNTVDPLGGSYYVESLTDKMEEQANKIFDEIDSLGGVVAAIDAGYFQKEIADAAYRYQRELEKKEKFMVGVNEFIEENEKVDIPILQISPEVERKQKERLAELRQNRDQKAVDEALAAISKAAVEGTNLMPEFIKAAECYVTLGEMINELKKHFGVYEEAVVF